MKIKTLAVVAALLVASCLGACANQTTPQLSQSGAANHDRNDTTGGGV
jgi:hypothetical protein